MSTSSFEPSGEKKSAGRASSRRSKRWIAVAAAVVVVAGGAVAIAASQGSDSQRSGTVISGSTSAAASMKIAVGGSTSCLVHYSDVQCWGDNSQGQAGNDTLTTPAAIGKVKTSSSAIFGGNSVSAGLAHGCGFYGVSAVFCWGSNDNGQVGSGNSYTPEYSFANPVTKSTGGLLTNLLAVSAGDDGTCAVTAAKEVWCWGGGDNVARLYSAAGNPVTALSYGGVGNVCMVTAPLGQTPYVFCSGGNPSGIPEPRAISVGGDHSCVVLAADGAVKCWGDNTYGQLGNGTTTASPGSLQSAGITNAIDVVAGLKHTCALIAGSTAAANTVKCWGDYSAAQIGQTPGGISKQTTPIEVAGLLGATAISTSSGSLHTCASGGGGGAGVPWVKCWGLNTSAQVSSPASAFIATPVKITPVP